MKRVRKAVAYIIRDSNLLVFEHRDYPEAGVQVPAGTAGDSEDLEVAVMREAEEETGLDGLRVVGYLGSQEFEDPEQVSERHYFVLTAEEAPEKWTHWERHATATDEDFAFNLYWLPIEKAAEVLHPVFGAKLGDLGENPKEIVRRGYNQISHAYRGDEAEQGTNYLRWAAELVSLLPAGGRVLDLGCGNGIPTSQILLREGVSVTGVDLSEVQIERARALLPDGKWIVADMSEINFEPNTFDAVVSLFAIIHLPLEEQPQLFDKMAIWLNPGGYLLASVGWKAWTGTEDFYGALMYWSHEGAGTYKKWLEDRDFEVIREEFVPEGSGGHTLLLARK